MLLDHRAHRAIHDEDAVAQEAGQEGSAVGLHAMGASSGRRVGTKVLNLSINLRRLPRCTKAAPLRALAPLVDTAIACAC
jgi:hypothetical protein